MINEKNVKNECFDGRCEKGCISNALRIDHMVNNDMHVIGHDNENIEVFCDKNTSNNNNMSNNKLTKHYQR